jgi:hypothetical protein
VITGRSVDVVVGSNEVTVLLVVDVVVAGGAEELDVELTVVEEAPGVVELVVDEDVPDVELVVDEDVPDVELVAVEVDVDVDVEGELAVVLEVEVAGTELEVVLAGSVVALLVVEIEVVVDDVVDGSRVLEGSVDVLVETVVLDVGGAVEGTVEVALVEVVAVLAVVAEVDVGGGSVASVVLLVVDVVVVANVPAKPPIWIRLSRGLPPKVVANRSSPVRASNSRPSGPTPKSDAKTLSTGDDVPRLGSPDCASSGSPLAASMRRTRSCPSSKLA